MGGILEKLEKIRSLEGKFYFTRRDYYETHGYYWKSSKVQ